MQLELRWNQNLLGNIAQPVKFRESTEKLSYRFHFCIVANKIFHLIVTTIYCEASVRDFPFPVENETSLESWQNAIGSDRARRKTKRTTSEQKYFTTDLGAIAQNARSGIGYRV